MLTNSTTKWYFCSFDTLFLLFARILILNIYKDIRILQRKIVNSNKYK